VYPTDLGAFLATVRRIAEMMPPCEDHP
jgi:hypothetical protein